MLDMLVSIGGNPLPLGPVAAQAAATGEGFKNITAGIGSIVTAVAVVTGGVWAYFKFDKGRTYRPRLSVDMSAEWLKIRAEDTRQRWRRSSREYVVHIRVRVTNIGASKVALNQFGTGLTLKFPSRLQAAPPDEFRWESVALKGKPDVPRVFEVFREHAWIEPGETVSDDLLLTLGREPELMAMELTLLWSLSDRKNGQFDKKGIEVFARRIVPPSVTVNQ